MSFGSGSTNTHTEEARVIALHVNQSAYGVAKGRVWGKQRVTANMLWYGDWTAVPHTETTTTASGGKGGGGGSSSSNTSYTYTAGMVMALCSGPIAGVGKVWEEKNLTDLATLGFTLKTGEVRQAPWSHLSANYPDQAVSYSGLAYVANNALDLGSSSSQPSISFEVFGERLIPGGDDAYPADVIYDIASDPLEGVGLSAALVAGSDDYALWCRSKNLVVSVAATSQTASRDVIAQILKATLSEAIWSNGQIKLVPYGDEPVGAWSPVTSPDYDITEADLLDAPRHRRKQPADATNRVTLNYTSRAKDYNTSTVTRDDLSAVTQYGVRPETIDLPCITGEWQAAVVCEFWRDRNLYIRNEWEIDVDERFCLVEAMDLLTLTFAPQGLSRQPVRVVEASDDGSGKVTLLVEEWPFGLLTATIVPTQSGSGYVPEYNVAPGPTNTPVIFEAPNSLTSPNLEIWIGASGGDHWGGARVWVSDDNNSYQQIGIISNPARHGVLTSHLAAGSDPDTTHALYVDMSVSHGQLLSGTRADADRGNTISWVDGELIAYETATLLDVEKYELSYLRRGQQGTASAGHATQSQFVRLDDAIFKYRIPRERIGSPVWIKLQSVNKYGRSPEPLDTVIAYLYTIAGNKPLPLTSLTATGGLFQIRIDWTITPGQVGIDYVEVWGAGGPYSSQAHQLTSQKYPVLTWNHSGIPPGESWFYWGRVIDTSGNASDFYPVGPTGGVSASPNSDPSSLLTQLEGALGMPQMAAELAEPIEQISLINLSNLNLAIDSLFKSLTNDLAADGTFSAVSAIASETINRDTAIQAETTARTTLAAKVADDILSAIQTEQTARATALLAEASERETLRAAMDDDVAAVQSYASASAGRITGVEAKWGVKVQTVQDGVSAVSGIELLSGDGFSTFAILADRFLIYQPNGEGDPKQVLTMGTVNGVTALGFHGSGIFDGTVVARSIDSRGLAIRDAEGVVILGSGTALSASYAAPGTLNAELTPLIDSAAASAIWQNVNGAGKPENYADVTSKNTAAGIANQGWFATLNQINAANVSTYIASAAIQTAQIGYAAIQYANIGDLVVDTLKIANNAIAIPVSGYASSGPLSVVINSSGAPIHITAAVSGFVGGVYSSQTGTTFYYSASIGLYRDGVMIRSFSFSNSGSTVWLLSEKPGAGWHTYSIGAYFTSPGGINVDLSETSILLLETKK